MSKRGQATATRYSCEGALACSGNQPLSSGCVGSAPANSRARAVSAAPKSAHQNRAVRDFASVTPSAAPPSISSACTASTDSLRSHAAMSKRPREMLSDGKCRRLGPPKPRPKRARAGSASSLRADCGLRGVAAAGVGGMPPSSALLAGARARCAARSRSLAARDEGCSALALASCMQQQQRQEAAALAAVWDRQCRLRQYSAERPTTPRPPNSTRSWRPCDIGCSLASVHAAAATLALRVAARAGPCALLRVGLASRRPLARAAPAASQVACSVARVAAMASQAACSVTTLETPHVSAAAATLAEAFDYDSPYSWSRPLGLPHDRFSYWLEHMYLPERVAGVHRLPVARRAALTVAPPAQPSPSRSWWTAARRAC